jgi:acylphosphatase
MADRAVQIVISGAVQGVGYRAFVEREAMARDLAGWVRNRRDGSVEAVFAGNAAAVEGMIAACRSGPRMASVTSVAVADYSGPALAGFSVLPTE